MIFYLYSYSDVFPSSSLLNYRFPYCIQLYTWSTQQVMVAQHMRWFLNVSNPPVFSPINYFNFVDRISDAPIHSNQMVSFDVVSLFTKVPIHETLSVVRDKLTADSLLEERTCILIDNLIEMLTFCVETAIFGMGSDIYKQEEGLAMGSPLSPVLANIYMEYFEEMALGTTSLKSSILLRFILWLHQEDVQISRELNPTIYTVHYGERARQQITLPWCISHTHRERIQVICVP